MKNCIKWIGIIVFTAVIVFSFAACKKDSLDKTTWKGKMYGEEYILDFNKPNFTLEEEDGYINEGSYSISGNTVLLKLGNEDDITGTLSGNTLSLTIEGETYRFRKQ